MSPHTWRDAGQTFFFLLFFFLGLQLCLVSLIALSTQDSIKLWAICRKKMIIATAPSFYLIRASTESRGRHFIRYAGLVGGISQNYNFLLLVWPDLCNNYLFIYLFIYFSFIHLFFFSELGGMGNRIFSQMYNVQPFRKMVT